jgi:hypothetical protein
MAYIDSSDNDSKDVNTDFSNDTVTIDIANHTSLDIFKYHPTVLGATGSTTSSWGWNGGNVTIGANGTGASNFYGNTNYTFSNSAIGTAKAGLSVTGDAEFEGDVKIKGVSIAKTLNDIQKRLSILVPDPAKLEHFSALKRAYENYKTLEALCELPTKDE